MHHRKSESPKVEQLSSVLSIYFYECVSILKTMFPTDLVFVSVELFVSEREWMLKMKRGKKKSIVVIKSKILDLVMVKINK